MHRVPHAGLAWLAVLATTLIVAPRAAHAQATAPDSSLYVLGAPSDYAIGCFGPCDCAVRSDVLEGSFHLRFVGTDPMYTHYAIDALHAVIHRRDSVTPVTGTGDYRIGGEVALTHELQLELVIGDAPPQAFDSGTVPGGGGFPAIDIMTAAHGFACFDTVIHVVAKPQSAGVPGGPRSGAALTVAPNPFRGDTELRVTLAAPARLDVTIVDGSGRTVRCLVHDLASAAGVRVLHWDGSDDRGARVRPGVYFARADWGAGVRSRRIVRLG